MSSRDPAASPAAQPTIAPQPAAPAPAAAFPLDTPLLRFSPLPRDAWTTRQACEGTLIFGATGAGKSTGSGQAIAKAFLRNNYGGLVLCAKPEEAAIWRDYARQTGRENSLIIFDASAQRRFNFLSYEARSSERLVTHNLVALFMRVIEATKGRQGGDGDNPFWRDSVSRLLSNAFALLDAAYGRVTLAGLMDLIAGTAQTPAEVDTAAWRDTSSCIAALRKAHEAPARALPLPDYRAISDYFLREWPRMNDRTRGDVLATLTSLINPFLTGYLRELFCTTTNVVPEMTHEGAILVIDLPIKEHAEAGILAQHIFKYLWQRATERRAKAGDATRPVFLWADECQFFVSEYDNEFQSTARSARACTVYLTQNLPALYTRIGGRNPEHATGALLGNFQTAIFHQNTNEATNRWAAELIGQVWQWVESHGESESLGESISESQSSGGGSSSGQGGGSTSSNSSFSTTQGTSRTVGTSSTRSRQVQFEVLPSAFNGLRKGGGSEPPEAIAVRGGRLWELTGRSWLRCAFPQG
ncbi:type IV secretory system conjugative DNA transfer family protein [Roseomonas mucosa]